jgi:uncharacterized membrane protein
LSDPLVIRRVAHLAVALTVMLILVVCGWILASGFSAARLAFTALATSPLWISLPKIRAGHRRTCALLTLVLVPYLVLALMESIANPFARGWAGATLFVAFALFVCLIAFLRVSRAPPSLPARTES